LTLAPLILELLDEARVLPQSRCLTLLFLLLRKPAKQPQNPRRAHTLRDVYFAESQILKALPKLAKKANSPDLKKAFETHLMQTQDQVTRLDKIFKMLGKAPKGVPCEAIKGILKEGDEVVGDFDGSSALDAGMIAAAQAVEHYEMARYGALRTWAEELGMDAAADLLEETLLEERGADQLLTKLAETKINLKAA
jgi:ferritin-like metal-binding protein YciE